MPVSDFTPTASQVADLIRARTVDTDGHEIGAFTSATRPTDTQVQGLIGQATMLVGAKVGADLPVALRGYATHLAALRAAMLVEMSYWPEQVNDAASPYQQLSQIADELSTALTAALEGESTAAPSASRGGWASVPATTVTALSSAETVFYPDALS